MSAPGKAGAIQPVEVRRKAVADDRSVCQIAAVLGSELGLLRLRLKDRSAVD